MANTLRCFSDSKLEYREGEGGEAIIAGYAAVYNSPSVDFGGWQEVVMPGAFDRSLKSGNDVVARVEHESGTNIIGRRSNGTLTLRSDDKGLYYEVTPPDTQMGRDITTLVKRGDISKSSFAFIPVDPPDGFDWDDSGKVPVRRLKDVDLFDVAPVGEPAYPGSALWSEERKRTVDITLAEIRAIRDPMRTAEQDKVLSKAIADLKAKYALYKID